MCHKTLRSQEFPIHEVATLIGTLASTFPGVKFGPLLYSCIDTWNGTKNWHTSLNVFVVNIPPSADSIGTVRVVSRLSLHSFPGY